LLQEAWAAHCEQALRQHSAHYRGGSWARKHCRGGGLTGRALRCKDGASIAFDVCSVVLHQRSKCTGPATMQNSRILTLNPECTPMHLVRHKLRKATIFAAGEAGV
jgi:hypothetical protein